VRQMLLWIILAAVVLPMPPANCAEDVTPSAIDVGATLNIVGPTDAVQPDDDAWLKIDGLTLDEIKSAKAAGMFDMTVFPLTGVRVHATYDWLNETLELMFTAKNPGEYLVKLHLVRDGKMEIAAIVVVVEGDRPNPPLPPDPPTPDPPVPNPTEKWQVMFFVESTDVDDLPDGQIELISSLSFRQSLEAAGHRFMGRYDRNSVMESKANCTYDRYGRKICQPPTMVVKSDLAPWWEAVKGDELPRMAIAPIDGGKVRDFPLPANSAELYSLLEAQQ
jgi:hypothetical protein